MKYCIKLFALLFLLNSCKNETKEVRNKTAVKTQKSDEVKISATVYKDYTTAPVDFLDEKYKIDGFEFQGSSPSFPTYYFFDENLGSFTVTYVGKSRLTRDYWDADNSTGFFALFKGNNKNNKLVSDKANEVLKQESNDYYILVNLLPIEEITECFDCDLGDFKLKNDAYNYFYVYENNKWVLIKRLLNSNIKNQGISLFTEVLLSHKLKDIKPIAEEFQGKFKAEANGEYTNDGQGHTTYYFTITKNKIDLKYEAFRGDFVCEGEYKGIQNDTVLELYYDREDDRCLKLDPTYLIKRENDNFFIKGIGGEGTINEWIKMDKE
ncbi:hypothetical protein [Flavobacterium panici]|uniref:Uncharacterized protein n=1 Tax=Flavobacterium panici TaxID=2654843 RepID=A0A9N8P240_9FLAO|nr:hypothetical protein [Flavobacterium panici]CAC9974702.1 hypothetical protein FLAPXU55_02399 [Flavobacterium panici]